MPRLQRRRPHLVLSLLNDNPSKKCRWGSGSCYPRPYHNVQHLSGFYLLKTLLIKVNLLSAERVFAVLIVIRGPGLGFLHLNQIRIPYKSRKLINRSEGLGNRRTAKLERQINRPDEHNKQVHI